MQGLQKSEVTKVIGLASGFLAVSPGSTTDSLGDFLGRLLNLCGCRSSLLWNGNKDFTSVDCCEN